MEQAAEPRTMQFELHADAPWWSLPTTSKALIPYLPMAIWVMLPPLTSFKRRSGCKCNLSFEVTTESREDVANKLARIGSAASYERGNHVCFCTGRLIE